jgi:hypothetical protein
LFQRFFSAKNDRSLSRIMILYPRRPLPWCI